MTILKGILKVRHPTIGGQFSPMEHPKPTYTKFVKPWFHSGFTGGFTGFTGVVSRFHRHGFTGFTVSQGWFHKVSQ